MRRSLPIQVTQVINRKQQLRNDIIDYLDKHNMTWCAQQVATEGVRFVACLVDLMWYIDGHHESFPTPFQCHTIQYVSVLGL